MHTVSFLKTSGIAFALETLLFKRFRTHGRRKKMIALQALPPIPNWTELHPLVIHFPIALLLVAPLLIVGALLVNPLKGRPFLITALVLMVLGTAGTFLAVATGEAAGELVQRTAAVSAVLERHEDLGKTTRIVFSVLTLIFAALLFLPRLFMREATDASARILPLAFLLFYCAGAVVLVNTAHNGGRLVHELGIHAGFAPSTETSTAPASDSSTARKVKTER
jgi:uncharacterized membrane protein